MTRPLLSVCLITYNQNKYIKEAIESILMQKVNFAWELVIADDASTDGTAETLLEYKEKFPELIKLILHKRNFGAEKTWHELMAYPKTKYVAYIEGDDYWTDPGKLQLQLDFLEKYPDFALYFHPAKVFFESGEAKQIIWPNLHGKTELAVSELLKENLIPSNSVVYRRQNYDNLPQGIMPGDWYFHIYNAQFGKIGCTDRVMSTYRRHSGGLWWDVHKNPDNMWSQYGIQHVALYVEVLKLYGDDNELKKIIHKSLSEALGKLIEVDNKYHEGLLKKALKEFSDFNLAEILSVNQHQELQEKGEYIKQKDLEIETLNTEMLDLRSQVFHLRDEVHSLRNARVLGRIIKLRDFIGEARKKIMSLPRSAFHKTRVVVAPFIPAPARRYIKRMLKPKQTLVTVANTKWDGQQPLVSVVVPYYNRADTIGDTINSLGAQTYKDFEIIIVDDGSTDPTSIKKLKDLKKSGVKAHFIYQDNQGVADVRNNGIAQAKGKYIICLDSDDALEPTFIEKATVVLETSPDTSLVTTHMETFGVVNDPYKHVPYDALQLNRNNMVVTAAEFKKDAWKAVGGYKSGLGYEDWEYWMNLAENGFFGKSIPEPLFVYRMSMQSRYVNEKELHWKNVKNLHNIHPSYKKNVKRILAQRRDTMNIIEAKTAFINLDDKRSYRQEKKGRSNILIVLSWMTFGGAETLIYNYCKEVKDQFNISFLTGLKSENEWEYKFKEITQDIYHLCNLFEDKALYLEFISNYIKTRNIDAIHIIHTDYAFEMLAELKQRHPNLKIVVTIFNDRAVHFKKSLQVKEFVDAFTTDNESVYKHYRKELSEETNIRIIPNGINSRDIFIPALFDGKKERAELGVAHKDLAVFFIGRLSEEKNPDVFLEVARKVVSENHDVKFFVIGDGVMAPEIKKQIEAIQNKNVQYLGYQTDIARYLSAADIFVLPSSIEGFPLSILEAMAMRVAVIASDVGAVSEIIDSGEDGFVVTPGSTSEIVDTISTLKNNPKLLAAVKSKARVKVDKKYSNTILGSNYEKLYKEITK